MLLNDCFVAPDKMVTLDQALAFLAERIQPVVGTEELPLSACAGRILAQDVTATVPSPAFDNSAMDGYAFRHADLDPNGGPTELPVTARVAAGHPVTRKLPPGQAARIFTGAPMPPGLDSVAMQEDCTASNRDGRDYVRLPGGLAAGNFVRLKGEDFPPGFVVLRSGRRLRPQDLGAAASAGVARLSVFKRLRVATFATGDELRSPGRKLPFGAIYDSNRFTLRALAEGLGCKVTDLGRLPDKFEVTRDALAAAAKNHDLLLTAGGVSVGEEDHVKSAVEARGSLHLWRMAIKPGKPTALGQIGDAAFVGLPGNPVSAPVIFMMFARPVILRLSGALAEPVAPLRFRMISGFNFAKDHARREFLRAHIETGADGAQKVILHRGQQSHAVSSLVDSQGLVDIGEAVRKIVPGDQVSFIPYETLRW